MKEYETKIIKSTMYRSFSWTRIGDMTCPVMTIEIMQNACQALEAAIESSESFSVRYLGESSFIDFNQIITKYSLFCTVPQWQDGTSSDGF